MAREAESVICDETIERALRFSKSELGAERVRVRRWEHRLKLPGLLTLAYAFLVQELLAQPERVLYLLRLGSRRIGMGADTAAVPLYRLHAALADLFAVALPPPIACPPHRT